MTTAPTRVDARETVASTEDLARVTVRYLAGALPSSPLRDRPVIERVLRDDIDAYVRACPRIASVLDGWVPGMIVDPILVDRPVLWGVLVGALPRISRA